MVEAPLIASDRYSVTTPRGPRRFLGRDHRLERDVLLWLLPAEFEDDRDRIVTLAATTARLTHPVFLQTLDLIDADPNLGVVLEAPADAEVTGEHPLSSTLPALVAATLTLRIGSALEEAAERGLVAPALPLAFVHLTGADEVRLDPIGLFEGSEAPPAVLVPLLTEFLASFLRGREGATRAFDPGADSVTSFVERWRERTARGNADELAAFLDELRRIARAPSGYYVEEDAAFQRTPEPVAPPIAVTPPSTPVDEETTALLPRSEASRGAPGRRAPEPRYAEVTGPYPRRADDPRRARRPRPTDRSFASKLITLMGFGLIAALVVVLILLGMNAFNQSPAGDADPTTTATSTSAATASTTPVPANVAALTVVARQIADVRITVDGNVAFEGQLKANESRSFQGKTNVRINTNNGKNIDVTVNGHALGALSPAVGHPEWNTVDWQWEAGWKP